MSEPRVNVTLNLELSTAIKLLVDSWVDHRYGTGILESELPNKLRDLGTGKINQTQLDSAVQRLRAEGKILNCETDRGNFLLSTAH